MEVAFHWLASKPLGTDSGRGGGRRRFDRRLESGAASAAIGHTALYLSRGRAHRGWKSAAVHEWSGLSVDSRSRAYCSHGPDRYAGAFAHPCGSLSPAAGQTRDRRADRSRAIHDSPGPALTARLYDEISRLLPPVCRAAAACGRERSRATDIGTTDVDTGM